MNTSVIDKTDSQPGAASNYSDLWRITEGQRLRYLCAVLAIALTNLCMFAAPIIGGHAIDVLSHQDFSYGDRWLTQLNQWLFIEPSLTGYLWLAATSGLLITGIGGVFLYTRGRLAAKASEGICLRLREALYQRLHHLRADFYDTADTGDLVQRCSSDVETLRVFLASDVIEIGRAVMLVICVVPILFSIHAPLAWWSLCLMPLLVIGAYVFFQKVKQAFEVTDEAEGAMTATLQENLTGIRVVRAFARQSHEIGKFAQRNGDFRDKNHRLIQLMGYYWSVSDFFAMSQLGIVLLMGAHFVIAGSLSVGDLFIFMTCESMVIWPVRQLGRVLTDTGKAVISLGRVNHILQANEEGTAWIPSDGRATGEIVARDLHVRYGDHGAVVQGLSIHIQSGETLAIVGPPGAGKTTFIRALLKLYPYESGSLTLDGHEIRELDRFWLRAQVGVVLQDPFLYARSILNNLYVGRPHASQADVTQACEDAAIRGAIEAFPEGYQQLVGERGVTLSGGQRQRLALARALLKNPPVLVLDDALSAVDTGTEAHILDALRQRQGRQTTIIIAHRLSSVRHADRILVMDQGQCVQLGTHAELAAQPGVYQRLCAIQGALDEQIRKDLEHVR